MSPAKKSVKKKAPVQKEIDKERGRETAPEYTVQLSSPVMLRKDVLESLREIIIFMQGYEKFRKLQEEKVATFNTLKNDVKGLSSLLDQKLRKYFPKGKLKLPKHLSDEGEEQQESGKDEEDKPLPKVNVKLKGLDELEGQLRDIESQLRSVE